MYPKNQTCSSLVVYMHPYEIDTEPRSFPTEHLSRKDRKTVVKLHKMQLRNRHTVVKKLFKLLSDFEFATMGQVIEKTYNTFV
jgi:hypothetical protein